MPYTDRAKKAMSIAARNSAATGEGYADTGELLLALLSIDCVASQILRRLGVTPANIQEKAQAVVNNVNDSIGLDTKPFPSTVSFKKAVRFAHEEAGKPASGKEAILGTEHLLLGLLREGSGVAFQSLNGLGVTHEKALAVLKSIGEEARAAVSREK